METQIIEQSKKQIMQKWIKNQIILITQCKSDSWTEECNFLQREHGKPEQSVSTRRASLDDP